MDYLNKYQTNDMCNFCDRFNKDCKGKMFYYHKECQNNYCPAFRDRIYANETPEYRIKRFSNYNKTSN